MKTGMSLEYGNPNIYYFSDNLRDHFLGCPRRDGRKIPETGRRGRKRHACHSVRLFVSGQGMFSNHLLPLQCTVMKLRCDGEIPCGSCRKRAIECSGWKDGRKNGEVLSNGHGGAISAPSDGTPPIDEWPGPRNSDDDREQSSLDRGSIQFLLNAGMDSFTEGFHLPPDERSRRLSYHKQLGLKGAANVAGPYVGVAAAQNAAMQTFVDFDRDTLDPGTFLNQFYRIYRSSDDGYSGETVYPTTFVPSLNGGQQDGYVPEKPIITALSQSILARVWSLPIGTKAKNEVSTDVSFLLTTPRISKFVKLYFETWQHNSPIIHLPSFDLESVPLDLLTAVVFMGAIYSEDENETAVANRLLDFAEMTVFSSNVFSCEHDIISGFNGTSETHDINDWSAFQSIVAGFILVNVQYWAGGRAAQSRAMEVRFSEVIKVSAS